jgi:hypothetical protein
LAQRFFPNQQVTQQVVCGGPNKWSLVMVMMMMIIAIIVIVITGDYCYYDS